MPDKMPEENKFPALCKRCGNKQPHQQIKKYLRGDAEEYLLQCATCGEQTHAYYTNPNLLKKADDIRKETNPIKRAHALRYYRRKFDEFNRGMVSNAA